MRAFLILSVICFGFAVQAQVEQTPDSLRHVTSNPVPVYTKDYMRMYNYYKNLIFKVYPYALHAADVLDEIDHNVESIEKRRKQNHFLKDAYKDLRDEFKYAFYEMYTSEGVMLMKLVHRETGLTVYEIAERYRGKGNAEIFQVMAQIWDQDLHVKFEPEGKDKIPEHVIRDIQSGMLSFQNEMQILSKEDFKVEQQKDKDRIKANKEKQREKKKSERKNKKENH